MNELPEWNELQELCKILKAQIGCTDADINDFLAILNDANEISASET